MFFRGFVSILALVIGSATLAAESIAPLGTYTPVERRHWAFRPPAHPETPKFSAAADLAGFALFCVCRWVSGKVPGAADGALAL